MPLITGVRAFASPQQDVSGVINSYTKVTSFDGSASVIVDDVSEFAEGDTVLMIQMKGISISTEQNPTFGLESGYFGEPGQYEFIIIELIEAGPQRITFRNDLLGSYDAEGMVQLVKVPSYESINVVGKLSCEPWDSISGTGGILVLIANNKVEMNADIDVSGKGFIGGEKSIMDGICDTGTDYYYPESSTLASRKGEGLASHSYTESSVIDITTIAKGRGAFNSGGGGAFGEFSGGGGGASFGAGGEGASQFCIGPLYSKGGLNVIPADFVDHAIMGSGGGAGGYSDGTGSSGGSGGGIVFILTDTLIGNGNSIRANGDSITVIASGNGSAGGGGAGGSVVLSVKTYKSSDIILEAKGGRGGHSSEGAGTGGGGGGGMIWLNSSAVPSEASTNVSGAGPGRKNYPMGTPLGGGSSSGPGIIRTDLNLLLNGFLFNSIISSYTRSHTDSICYGDIPEKIIGTDPVGGVGNYTFRWEKKGDSDLNWILVPGSTSTRDLILTAPETDTLQFRRVVTDENVPVVADTSKPVLIIVQPLITDNLVGYDTIICAGQDPLLLIPQNSGPGGGNNIYSYQWIDSTDIQNWQNAPGAGMNDDYDPPLLNITTYYSRIISSGRCIDTSNIVKVNVLPVITNNTITDNQLICNDMLFDDLAGSDPADGDGSYTYEWISSTDGSNWLIAEGTADEKNYDPDEESVNFPGDQYYKRIVRSGHLDCCVDTSAQVLLTSLPVIANNTISADQTICEGDIPDLFSGSDPSGGGGTYTYLWQDSIRAGLWSDIASSNARDYAPGALIDTTWYRRLIFSSACDDTSNVIVVEVHPSIINNTIETLSGNSDTIICSGQTPSQLVGELPSGGDASYLYEWQLSTDLSAWTTAPGVNNVVDYSPQALTADTWFRREVISGECSTYSDTIKISVLPLITNNSISAAQTICYNTQPDLLIGTTPVGGDGIYTYMWEESSDNSIWNPAQGTNDNIDYQAGILTIPMYYKRKVLSGLSDCCKSTSNVVNVGIYALPTGIITVAKDTICEGEQITVNMALTGAAPWDIILNDGSSDLSSFSAAAANHDFTHQPGYSSDYSFVSIIDNNSCVATSMAGIRTIIVYEVPVSDPGTDDEVCGLDYTLVASPSAGTGQWLNYQSSISSITDISSSSKIITVNSYGDHVFWWKETNWECVDSSSVNITFWEQPADAVAGEDKELFSYEFEFALEAEDANVGTGTWSVVSSAGTPVFADDNYAKTIVSDLSYGDNILDWTIINGVCPQVSDQVSIKVKSVFIPQGFSPNGDAVNQTFMINGLENTSNELIITNVSGALVFQAKDYKNDWEGNNMDGKALPEGTYYYYLTVKTPVSERYNGFVVIKR